VHSDTRGGRCAAAGRPSVHLQFFVTFGAILPIVAPFAREPYKVEHLVGCQIGEWDTHGFSRLDAIGDGYKRARGPYCVLGIAAADAEIGD
jgi:hypothetical protein